jgi:hypothetical protein
MRTLIFSILALLLGACQSSSPVVSSGSPNSRPEIVSSVRSSGKGVPNGRSDSRSPYWDVPPLEVAGDQSYGRSPENPIRTGPAAAGGHVLFLNALRGPNGEPVEYERKGACCEFLDASLAFGGGLLDVYLVKVDGSNAVIELYVDMYRPGRPQLPAGFKQRR